MRIVVARCQVDYAGRLSAHLPMATRVLMIKADGSVLVHSDGGSYKPLNWMSPPCTLREGTTDEGRVEWTVTSRASGKGPEDTLRILLEEIHHDTEHELGVDPGLQKDGVEKHLQELLAEHPATLSPGLSLVRREFPTAIGPVDLMCRDANGESVAVEIKRRGDIDGVEQLTRYLELLNRDPLLRPVRGIFAAQEIRPQARVLATRPRHHVRDRRLQRAARARRPVGPAVLMRIFHLAEAVHWEEAQRTGTYAQSTLGRTLDDEGFLHASREDQWETVRATFYADHDGPLVLLEIDTDLLTSPWQEDPVGDTTFPHVYGPLNTSAVVSTRSL